MAKTIKTELFFEAGEGETCLWNVSSVIYKNLYEKARDSKKLVEQFSVTCSQKSYCCSMFILVCLCLFWLYHLE